MSAHQTHKCVENGSIARGAFLYTSASMIAMLVAAPASAQTVINDGDNVTVTSAADGETISAAAGVTSSVDGAPVVVVDTDDVTVDNAGTLVTTGITQTVQVNQGTTGAVINNAETGRLEGASRVVNFDGTDATLNNDGVILGTGSQRNGAVYANRTSNNITINNAATGSIDAGVEGAGIAIEVGGGGAPIDGSITNEGAIQGRGQAPASGGTAGDGIRFFGPGLAPDYVYAGDITNSGLINSESTQGTTAGIRFANRIGFQGTLTNEEDGVISGAQNGLYFGNDADHTGGVVNNAGTISSDSRALNIDGIGLVVNNTGSILGTGDQRNGTVYVDSTAQDFELNNLASGVIDAGMGNEGAGFSVELASAESGGNAFSITNDGTIQGRGNASAGAATAGDGLRFERTRVGGVLEGSTDGLFVGNITNTGTIASEAANGTAGGIRFVNGVSFQGVLDNSGTISGVQNGLYFGNPTPAGGGDFSQATVNNSGTISSDSRALNIDGIGLTVNNSGSILGTGNQRNGTVYADSTAQGFTLNNLSDGVIDAGMGNEGAAFSVELSAEGNDFTITNEGLIQGRGQAGAGDATAGDGLRFERTRVGGALDGSTTGLFTGTITNSGTIASESAQGTAAGIRFVNGVSFQGTLTNEESGVISGVQNGLYFGNPVPAGGADHTGGVVNNAGTISSDSRALNIDGIGLTVNNLATGEIIGTGNQRNGTVYADSTAQDFAFTNAGLVDAGEGNQGSGFGAEIAPEGNTFDLVNTGTIQGRGQASAAENQAGDGVRIGNVGNIGVFDGTITNSGVIASESMQGTTAGIRFVNGIGLQGTLTNEAGGVISGVQNGLYFGNPVGGEGADHTGGVVNNAGTISSDSRALNIDGIGLTVNNLATGEIIGTGNQRNGTVYADSTAQDFAFTNAGLVDAGEGNQGSGFGAEIAPEGNTFDLVNTGTIQGRGQASAAENQAGDGVRIGNVGNIGVFDGTITNSGVIASESMQGTTAGIRFVNGIGLQGTLTNEAGGVISGVQNGLYFGNPVGGEGADHTGGVVNNAGTISSDSRALNIDGIGLTVNNSGSILGTGNQRNGTVYADSTAQDFTLNNTATGVIDAGMGNEGAAFSVELASAASGGNAFDITNAGTIQGRGNASAGAATAGDGLRFERTRNMGALDATSDGLFVGNITNSGTIASEAANGTAGGIRFVNGVSFQGVLDNSGTISGVQNGLYFGNPTPAGGGDFTGAVVNNSGVISSDSRALNIDGIGLTVNNTGQILGTGNQRNGTVYADGTADAFTFTNAGTIDAGVGNQGSGFGAEIGGAADGANTFTLTNTGTIQGRGQAGPMDNQAGDGVRIGNVGNTGTFDGVITNSGLINSESTQGPVSGLRVVNGVDFTGELNNSGTISGGNHGLYLGAGDHSAAVITNSGTLAGGVNAFFAGNATAAVSVTNDGGTLIGNFVGSAFDDTLTFTGTGNLLQGDILNSVDVTTTAGSATTISGARTLNGSFTHNGTLDVSLGVDSLAVEGDTLLGAGSVVNIATDIIGQDDVGTTFDVLTETGNFTNEGAVVNVNDDDFLLDYEVILGSLSVSVSASDLAGVSSDSNIDAFANAVSGAVADIRLADDVFTALNSATSVTQFEESALTLLPAIHDGVAREIYETQRFASSLVQNRLAGEGVGLWGQAFYRSADADPTSLSSLGYDADATGITLGLDGKVGETATLGVLFNYSDIEVDANGTAGARSEIDAIQIGGYAGFDLG